MADLDLLSADEAKGALGIKGDARNNRLAQWITAVSLRLDLACGAVVQRAVTEDVYPTGTTLRLKHPVTTFTTVTEYVATTGTVLTRETISTNPTSGYLAAAHATGSAPYSGVLTRRSAGATLCWQGPVSVAYVAGRYADTASVEATFKEAALVMVRNLSRADEPSVVQQGEYVTPTRSFPSFAVPKAVRELLRDEWREIPGVG